MAHGLLNPSKGSNLEMEDVGNNYFTIFLQRSLLQEAKFDMNGNVISCKMHDLVHDFALERSKGQCLTIGYGALTNDIKAMHLSIVPDESNNLNISEKDFSRLKTLHVRLSFGVSCENFLADCKFKHLHVAVVVDRKIKELPISISKLKYLRYLDISWTRIRALPESFSRLYNLQTLELPLMRDLPKKFGNLVNLRHLYINEKLNKQMYLHLKALQYYSVPGIGQLTSLRTLSCFLVGQDKGCKIEELSNLNHLEGTVRIARLENVANEDDARRANLSGKRNVESLELIWGHTNSQVSSNDERVLEGLQPHMCLRSLKVFNFMGTGLPSWILLLRNLMNMELRNLANCEQIPPLGHLPFLKILHIRDMSSVKYIGNDFYGWSNLNLVSANSSQTSVVVFPSLKELIFISMSSLEEWSSMVQPSFISSSSVELFPSLEKLEISSCPRLTRLPEDIISASTSLESLSIQNCDKLPSIPDLSHLCSLKELCISDCQELSDLPHGIEACRSLQNLTITCPVSVLEILPHYLTNLMELTLKLSNNIIDHYVPTKPDFNIPQYLYLIGFPELKSLPEPIQRFTTLRDLTLDKFDGLETLPEWLGNFHFLESLNTSRCMSLANFPSVQVMQGLTNLKSLRIENCPILKQRCEKGSGAEWHKIAHIPHIYIK